MNLLRIGLFLLLSLALPVNGMAQLLVSAKACPMHQHPPAAMAPADGHAHDHGTMAPAAHGAAMDHAQPHAGCDHAQEGLDAKLCKSGLDCKTGSLFQAVLDKTPDLPLGRPGPVPLNFDPLPGQPEPLWHPPRA